MISSVSSSLSTWAMPRPDISKVASNLFSQLDTEKQGYLEESDLAAAFSQISTDDSSSAVSSLFSQLDANSDGKVSESEMTSGLQQLAEQLDSGFNNMRTQGMMGGMPPPPPPDGVQDSGFTEDELTAQLSAIGSTDSAASGLISTVLSDFSAADADGDGKVTFQEAMTYQQSVSDSSSTTTGVQSDLSTGTDTLQAEVLRRMMQLMAAYGGYGANSIIGDTSSLVSSLSVSA